MPVITTGTLILLINLLNVFRFHHCQLCSQVVFSDCLTVVFVVLDVEIADVFVRLIVVDVVATDVVIVVFFVEHRLEVS